MMPLMQMRSEGSVPFSMWNPNVGFCFHLWGENHEFIFLLCNKEIVLKLENIEKTSRGQIKLCFVFVADLDFFSLVSSPP